MSSRIIIDGNAIYEVDLIFSVFFTYIFITLNRGGHMEKKPPLVMTPFDESLTNDFLQLVKIILPYLPDHVQRIAGIYVKLTELMNAFYCFHAHSFKRQPQPRIHCGRINLVRPKMLICRF